MDIQFLRRVLPSNDGYFFLWAMDDQGSAKDRRNHSTGYQARRVDTARHFLEHEQVSPTHGVFYTPFTFTQRDWKEDQTGKRRHPRKFPDLMLECRAFWLDVDIGKPNTYPDERTALTEILRTCRDSDDRMPAPTIIVRSGGGLHCYWVLDTPLGYGPWCDAARRFKQFFLNAGVKFDPTCTADPARILRVPGTKNCKLPDNPRDVAVLHTDAYDMSVEYIDLWPEAQRADARLQGLFVASSGGDELSHDVSQFKAYTRNIVQRCNVFRRVAADNGASCDEPLWKDVLQTVKMTEDAEDWVHELSRGHPGYDPADTETKFAQRELGKGITCEAFAAHFDAADHPCTGCPLQGKGHSPLKFGGDTEPTLRGDERAPLPGQPRRLLIFDTGMVVKKAGKKADDEPIFIPVCQSVLEEVEALQEETSSGLNPYLRLAHVTGGRRHRRLLSVNALASPADGKREMNRAGLAIPGHAAYSEMSEVMQSWYSQLAQAGRVAHLNRTQGWLTSPTGALEGFVVGDRVYYVDGHSESTGSSSDDGAVTAYTPTGELEPWQEAAQAVVGGGSPALTVLLAASFGAPLARLMGNSGYCASLSLYSPDSGVGKSTTLRVARAIWAAPNSFAVLDDTYNGVMATLRAAPYLPLMWDDPRKAKTRTELRELLFQIAAGRTKQRSNVDGTAADVVRMHTIGIVTSNEPLMGELSEATALAEAKRVLEMRVDTPARKTPDAVFAALDDNYGHAGRVYIEYVTQNMKTVRQALVKAKELVRQRIGHDAADRFYANTLTCCLVGASIANRVGLTQFDVKSLTDYLVKVVEQTRVTTMDAVKDNTAENDVLMFIASPTVQGGVVDVFAQRGRAAETVEVLRRPADVSRPWQYVIEDSTGGVRFLIQAFEEWYEKRHGRKLNRPAWYERAAREKILGEVAARRSMAVGTLSFPSGRQQQVVTVYISDLVNGMSDKPKGLPSATGRPASAQTSQI